ncbi:MAG TPA: hypothetical protein VKA89_01315 [Solirubrobacterales bacterium]|nr:hypothetical protein [Solirubrobacterales bacterium]
MAPRRITAQQAQSGGRRLVLISNSAPEPSAVEAPPLRIVGSQPRVSGGFRLTDR